VNARTLALSLLAGSTLISAAAAQDVAPPPPDDGQGVADIVVTARRRVESIQDTPIAVTAITAASLESRAAVSASSLSGAAPNLLLTQQNSGAAATNLSIRGLGFADVEKSFEPTVGVVVDGVFIGTSTGQYLDLFDIETIEVLRGPQGTLFGRNTIGGVINVRRTRPTGEFGVRAQLSYASYDTFDFRVVLNTPIVEDRFDAKLFVFGNGSSGYYSNDIRNVRTGDHFNVNIGGAFRFRPTDTLDLLLTVEYLTQDFEPVNSNIAQTGEVFCLFQPANECNRNTTTDLYTVFGDRTDGFYHTPAITLEANWDVGALTLTSITGYRSSNEAQTQDFDSSSADLYYTNRLQTYDQFSQEVRGAGDLGDRVNYIAGAFFFTSEYELTQFTRLFGADLPAPQIVSGTNRSIAIFADMDWEFIDSLRLSVGARQTWDRKSIDNTFGVPLGEAEESFSKFTPKVGLDWQPNDDFLIYGSWSRGYRSGGFSNRAQTPISTVTPYGTETVDSYEVGFKGAFFDRRLLFNVSAFYADYSDLQQNTTIPGGPTGNETIVFNVGSATNKGFEIDLTARPTRNWNLTGSFGYLEQEFEDFITRGADPVSGAQATFDYSAVNGIYAPRYTASINTDYTFDIGQVEAVLFAGYRYIARYDQQISIGPYNRTVTPNGDIFIEVLANDPRVRSDQQNLLDASLRLNFDVDGHQAHVMLFGRNLLDDRGPNAAFTVAGLWSFASAREPRVIGVRAGFNF
jgi:iron complex outermembrane receptor protein